MNTKNETIIISDKEFDEYLTDCYNFMQKDFDDAVHEVEKMQPALFDHILFTVKSEHLDKAQRDFMILFFISTWKVMKNYPVFLEKQIELKYFDAEYKNNQEYFRNIGAIDDKKEFDIFIKYAYQGYNQKKMFLLIFKYFFKDELFKETSINNLLNWFCISKSCIDVVDKVLNNKYQIDVSQPYTE